VYGLQRRCLSHYSDSWAVDLRAYQLALGLRRLHGPQPSQVPGATHLYLYIIIPHTYNPGRVATATLQLPAVTAPWLVRNGSLDSSMVNGGSLTLWGEPPFTTY